jgi:hypothetical protein
MLLSTQTKQPRTRATTTQREETTTDPVMTATRAPVAAEKDPANRQVRTHPLGGEIAETEVAAEKESGEEDEGPNPEACPDPGTETARTPGRDPGRDPDHQGTEDETADTDTQTDRTAGAGTTVLTIETSSDN